MKANNVELGLLASEERLYLPEALKQAGVQTSIWSAYRWVIKGVRGVRLEAYREGGRWRTSKEAVLRFLEASTRQARKERSVGRTNQDANPSHRRRTTAAALEAIYRQSGTSDEE